jgi:hypothetical protein
MSNKLFENVTKFVFLNISDSTNKIYIHDGIKKGIGHAMLQFCSEYFIFSSSLRNNININMCGTVSKGREVTGD